MPLELLKTLDQHPQIICAACNFDDTSPPENTLDTNVAGLAKENHDEVLESNLNTCIKIGQDANYNTLMTWMAPQHLWLGLDNYLYRDSTLVVVEDNSLWRGVTHLFHNSLTARHPGISKTINLIAKHYWWPHMNDFITTYVKGCATC